MSLPRKTVRFYLDEDYYRALSIVCATRGQHLYEFVEAEVGKIIEREIHYAKVIATNAGRLKISPPSAESLGSARNPSDESDVELEP